MKQKLIDALRKRIADPNEFTDRQQLSFLREFEVTAYIDTLISTTYLYTRPKKGRRNSSLYMAELICAIGHAIRTKLGFPKNSATAARVGGFMVYTFESLGLMQIVLGAGANGHCQYIIQILDDAAICALWEKLANNRVEKLPSFTKYAPWDSSRHITGMSMVKTQSKHVLGSITPKTHPMLFDCLNKAQDVGWRINDTVYKIYVWALANKTEAFAEIWELANPEARATKMREAKSIGRIAKRMAGNTFYHIYYFDFRGRKYPASAYLHEQGSDLARGMLLRDDKAAIGKEGFFWLMVSIASNWAGSCGRADGAKTDKIPLQERFEWAMANEDTFLSYAAEPKVCTGWMQADKPWQFLAACLELANLRTWQMESEDFEDFSYESHLECYIDGSNNGSQHLSALTRDEVTAPHVNLVPLDLPGDLYAYVAEHVWKRLDATIAEYTAEELEECTKYIDTVIELKRRIVNAPMKSEARIEALKDAHSFKENHVDIAGIASPVFWKRITDVKQRRKIVKRNVMTLPYGGSAYGLG